MVRVLFLIGQLCLVAGALDLADCPGFPKSATPSRPFSKEVSLVGEQCNFQHHSIATSQTQKIQETYSALEKETAASEPLESLGTFQGAAIRCTNYSALLSAEQENAFERFTQNLLPSDNSAYALCFKENEGPAFARCSDAVMEQRLQTASTHCSSAKNPKTSSRITALASSLVVAYREWLSTVERDCLTDQRQPALIHVAQATRNLGELIEQLEATPGTAGVEVALMVSLLDSAAQKGLLSRERRSFPKDYPATLTCPLLGGLEKDLACPNTATSSRDIASVSKGTSTEAAPSATLGAVLSAMERVESRSAEDMFRSKSESASFLVGDSTLDALTLALNQKLSDPTTSAAASKLSDYLGVVARDLSFLASLTPAEISSGAAMKNYLGKKRLYLYPAFKSALNGKDAQYLQSLGALGTAVDLILKSYSAYESALRSGNAEAIRKTGTELSHLVEETQSASPEKSDPLATLAKATELHWRLTLPEASLLRQMLHWEWASTLDQALTAGLTKAPFSAFKTSQFEKANARLKDRAEEVAKWVKEMPAKRKTMSAEQVDEEFRATVQPFFEDCVWLAAGYPSGGSDYEKACSELTCWDGSGIPHFSEKKPGATSQLETQCSLVHTQRAVASIFRDRFRNEGSFCAPPPPKTLTRKLLDALPSFGPKKPPSTR